MSSGTALPPPDPASRVHDRFHPAAAHAVTIGGEPTAEQAAAIVAAIEHLWPHPVLVLPDDTPVTTPPWRFSGRWWSKPVAARRDRPWY